MQDLQEVKIIQQFEGEQLSEIRVAIQQQLQKGIHYLQEAHQQPHTLKGIKRLAQERLLGVIGRFKNDGDWDADAFEKYAIGCLAAILEALSNNPQMISDELASTLFLSLSSEDQNNFARWQSDLNFEQDLTNYTIPLGALSDVTSLELIMPLEEEGAYAGSNYSMIPGHIDPHNQFDWIIRAFTNCIQKSSDNTRGVYLEASNTIWLGCANIPIEKKDGGVEYDIAQLRAMLHAVKPLYRVHPDATIIFNTRVPCFNDKDGVSDMGHYETFLLRSGTQGVQLIHRNSQATFFEIIHRRQSNKVSQAVLMALTSAYFKVTSVHQETSRYNQNEFSCGPSAVGEVMDCLIDPYDAFDGFLIQSDEQGQQRSYDALSPTFRDSDGQFLTREVFMRLVQYYFVTHQQQHPQLQHLLVMGVFGCFLRDKRCPDILYPVPGMLLEQYAKVAYPTLFGGVLPCLSLTQPQDFSLLHKIQKKMMRVSGLSKMIFDVLKYFVAHYIVCLVSFGAFILGLIGLKGNPALVPMFIYGMAGSILGLSFISRPTKDGIGLKAHGFLPAPKIKMSSGGRTNEIQLHSDLAAHSQNAHLRR